VSLQRVEFDSSLVINCCTLNGKSSLGFIIPLFSSGYPIGGAILEYNLTSKCYDLIEINSLDACCFKARLIEKIPQWFINASMSMEEVEEKVDEIKIVSTLKSFPKWKKEICSCFVLDRNQNNHNDFPCYCSFAHSLSEKNIWDKYREKLPK
jgi:hypothetical protein